MAIGLRHCCLLVRLANSLLLCQSFSGFAVLRLALLDAARAIVSIGAFTKNQP